jgi:hypothetical protein
MRPPDAILAEIHAVQTRLLRFLEPLPERAPASVPGDEPILFERFDDPDLSERLAQYLPDERAFRAFARQHAEAEERTCLPLWLSVLGTDANLRSRMRSILLAAVEKTFPLTEQPVAPFPLGERAMASLVLVHNLVWLEARAGVPAWKRHLRWLRGGPSASLEDEALLLASRLLEFLRWDLPPDPTGEIILLDILLNPLLLKYLGGWSQKPMWGTSKVRGHWLHIWSDMLQRSPVTLVLNLERIVARSKAETGGGWLSLGFLPTGPRPLAERTDPCASLLRSDWRGMAALAERQDFDFRGPLLQKLAANLKGVEKAGAGPPELPEVVRSALRALKMPLEHSGLPTYPTGADLERFLLTAHSDG